MYIPISDEIDSEWEFGRFIVELACGWIQARQAGGADHRETAKTLLSWIDRDNYGFFHDLGSSADSSLSSPAAGFRRARQAAQIIGRQPRPFYHGLTATIMVFSTISVPTR